MGLNWVEYVFEKRRGRERAKGLGTPTDLASSRIIIIIFDQFEF
jgi:hypothetical protein